MPTCLDACFSYSCTATTHEKHSEGKRDHGRRRGMKTASHWSSSFWIQAIIWKTAGHLKTEGNTCSRGCKVEKLAKMWWCDFREQDLRQVILLCISCRYIAVHLFFDLNTGPATEPQQEVGWWPWIAESSSSCKIVPHICIQWLIANRNIALAA